MSAKKRFRPLWVILHWLMAILVFVTFSIGLFSLAYKPNTEEKLVPLAVHMLSGIAILAIIIARYILRLLVFQPRKHAAGVHKKQPFLDQLSIYVHPLLYFFTALMALMGIAIAIPADLISTVFFKTGAALPENFYVFPARTWHGTLSLILMLLITQHVLVAIFHQFLKGENFLGRMWFTKSALNRAGENQDNQ